MRTHSHRSVIGTIEALIRDHPKLGIIAGSGCLAHDASLYLNVAGALGATRTLQRPFDLPTLMATINAVLAGGSENQPRSNQPTGKSAPSR